MTNIVPIPDARGGQSTEKVTASPTKLFFVQMLTRDIDLKDAVLDLLDNCLDGLLRSTEGKVVSSRPYEGYWAEIIATGTNFTITDNCGGIPKDVAINSAFRLGRSDLNRDTDLPTVGMYGIGMKRALFKMGRHSMVISKHKEDSYYVEIPPKWLTDDRDWDLALTLTEPGSAPDGTVIMVDDLYGPIAERFGDSKGFLDDLRKDIANLYSVIIDKGFKVVLNGKQVQSARIPLLAPRDFGRTKTVKISPYIFKTYQFKKGGMA